MGSAKAKYRTVVVEVAQEDIRGGVKKHMVRCAVAKAVRRATKLRHIQIGKLDGVGDRKIILKDCTTIDLPKKARDFIQKFDDGEPVKPFSFRVRIPEAS